MHRRLYNVISHDAQHSIPSLGLLSFVAVACVTDDTTVRQYFTWLCYVLILASK